jgi:hypothetical protein
MTDWKRSMTIGLGPSSPRRATTGVEAGPDRESSGECASVDCATRAAAGRALVGVQSLAEAEAEQRRRVSRRTGAAGVSALVARFCATRQTADARARRRSVRRNARPAHAPGRLGAAHSARGAAAAGRARRREAQRRRHCPRC